MVENEGHHPFYAKFKGGPFDGLEIAARTDPVPFVMWLEADRGEWPPVFVENERLHRYERISYNDGMTWVFEFTGHVVSV